MERPHSAKIYIKVKEQFCNFMWANVGPDGSIMMGFQDSGSEKLNFILDKNMGLVEASDIQIHKSQGAPKVNFHKSGNYKLSTSIGRNPHCVDRCTIVGAPLSEIRETRRMMEILIPKNLNLTDSQQQNRDITLDATKFPYRPLRCTISCMSPEKFDEIMTLNVFFVDTSEYEFTQALTDGRNIWTWTLRVSREDKIAPDNFHYFIPGEIKWSSAKHTI